MRAYNQWIVWRLEEKPGTNKPTKVPYVARPNSGKASVTDAGTWVSFDDALKAPLTCDGIVPWNYHTNKPSKSVGETGFSGIGFVFTQDDPFTGIDLDDTHGDVEAYERQLKIFHEFDSYSELSPSGNGVHIIVKGSIPHGRRRAEIELYCAERYFTMTGNVQRQAPIADRQALLQLLFDQMGNHYSSNHYTVNDDKEQKHSDDEVIAMAAGAVNGEKFSRLHRGDWQGEYPSQSEADMAYVDIIAFYTQNFEQIRRLFRLSALGQTPKDNYNHRGDRAAYVEYMVRKSFDRQLPKVDAEGLRLLMAKMMNNSAAAEPGGYAAALDARGKELDSADLTVNSFPPGLLGQVAQFIMDVSPRPVPQIALAGAIGLLSGICGRAYNVSGTGLNQYVLLMATTGTGKDAIALGISKLMAAVAKSVPAAKDFLGPGELVSSAGLIKWIDKKPAILSVLGEVGIMMQQMASDNASAHLKGLQRTLLQMYSKSGSGNTFDPSAYSDKEKNTGFINSPSLTIIGETVPHTFYELLDDAMIASGLLPRFLTFEYTGARGYLIEGRENIQPSFVLSQQIADLCAACLTMAHNGNVHNVPLDNEAQNKFRDFDHWTTDQINGARSETLKHLWNRAHLKALKLAAVCAVGINPTHPLITTNETLWATELVVNQTNALISKFESGEVGQSGGNEVSQINEVIKAIGTTINEPFERYAKYGDSDDMHRDGVVTHAHIQRKVTAVACFRNDKSGASNAIKRSITALLESDELRELPKSQMMAKYGRGAKAYVVAMPLRFVEAAKRYAEQQIKR
jgi:hypothetical protein